MTNLDLALAAATNNAVAGQINWFQYGADTYAVQNVDGTNGIDATDIIVKLTGTVDLAASAVAAGVLTVA